jgi:dihydropteroate synthase
VVQQLAQRLDVPVSIDTRKATVARAAVQAGASIVNDVWGLRGDPDMAQVVAESDVALVAMHNQRGTAYDDVVRDVYSSLEETLRIAGLHGIDKSRVIVDPGFGFGKTPAQNLEVMRNLGVLRSLGCPILVGPSRKSTIGLLLDGEPANRRLEGSLALAVLAAARGADIVRVHDVVETVRALRVADAVIRGTPVQLQNLAAPGPTG